MMERGEDGLVRLQTEGWVSQRRTELSNTQRCTVTSVWFGQELISEEVQEKSVETIKEKVQVLSAVSTEMIKITELTGVRACT